jgi:hypothetical protein
MELAAQAIGLASMWWLLIPAVLIGYGLNRIAKKKSPAYIDQAIDGYLAGTRDRESLMIALNLAHEIGDKERQSRIIKLLSTSKS